MAFKNSVDVSTEFGHLTMKSSSTQASKTFLILSNVGDAWQVRNVPAALVDDYDPHSVTPTRRRIEVITSYDPVFEPKIPSLVIILPSTTRVLRQMSTDLGKGAEQAQIGGHLNIYLSQTPWKNPESQASENPGSATIISYHLLTCGPGLTYTDPVGRCTSGLRLRAGARHTAEPFLLRTRIAASRAKIDVAGRQRASLPAAMFAAQIFGVKVQDRRKAVLLIDNGTTRASPSISAAATLPLSSARDGVWRPAIASIAGRQTAGRALIRLVTNKPGSGLCRALGPTGLIQSQITRVEILNERKSPWEGRWERKARISIGGGVAVRGFRDCVRSFEEFNRLRAQLSGNHWEKRCNATGAICSMGFITRGERLAVRGTPPELGQFLAAV
ncbi:hypothetical protein GGX14DRAFT_406075 [Mycena pura]|uniref:Uncharacterized protein n=1 Tax=Mycena pura TaxID=153505 RepID=A0AAD6Y5S3_9AGAR|nr:hypothetical protein GGX14DRAFT_406075 [Mycena pura]